MPARPVRQTAVAALAVVLTSDALHCLFSGGSWYPRVLVIIAVVAAVGMATRWQRWPAVGTVLAQLVAVGLTLTGLFARHTALLGVLPTPRSLTRLGDLVSDGSSALGVALFPTVPSQALLLLTVGAVGLIALLVDLLAVGLHRPTVAGLPLVLLIAVPAAMRERSVGFEALLAAAVAFLLLVGLDAGDRTESWGRVLTGSKGPLPSTAAGNAGSALQIGLVALAVAVVVPIAVPGATTSPFSGGNGPGNGGGSNAQIIDPLVTIASQLTRSSKQTLLTVRSPTAGYLRLTALEQFGDNGFTLGRIGAPSSARVSKGLPVADGADPQVGGATVTESITATGALAENLLPVPDGTRSVRISGDWRLARQTRTIFSSNDTTRGRTWTVQTALPALDPGVLRAGGSIGQPAGAYGSDLAVDLSVPEDLPAVVHDTARAWTAGSTSTYDAALAIQQHFTGGDFRYDTTATFDPGPAGFSEFLADRLGFCEQYATTMTAMLRTLGVPARVAIGFTAGTSTPDGTHTITGADAHAWPEVWFTNVGWVRFEPTPRSDGLATAPSYTVGRTTPATPGRTTTSPAVTPAPTGRSGKSSQSEKLDHIQGEGGAGATPAAPTAGRRHHGRSVGPWVLVALLLVLAAAASPGATVALRRRRRLSARGTVEEVWAQLLDDARDRGVRVDDGLSPRAAGAALTAALPAELGARTAVRSLVTALEESRYAPDRGTTPPDGAVEHERTLRRSFDRYLTPARRVVVVLWPASGRAEVRMLVSSIWPALLAAADRVAGRRRTTTSAAHLTH